MAWGYSKFREIIVIQTVGIVENELKFKDVITVFETLIVKNLSFLLKMDYADYLNIFNILNILNILNNIE